MIPPRNPLTIAINGYFIDQALNDFAEKFLQNYELVITSAYRTETKNKEVGGAPDSAHLFNLARDLVLFSKDTKKPLTAEQLKKVWDETFSIQWPGYTYFKPAYPDHGPSIHVNIERTLTEATKWAGLAATGLIATFTISRMINARKKTT